MAWVSKDTAKGRSGSASYVYYRVKETGPEGRVRVLGSFRRKPEAYAFLDRYQRAGPEALVAAPAAKGTLTVADLARRYLVDKFQAYEPDVEGPVAGSHLRQSIAVLERFKNAVGADRPAVLLCEDDAKLFHRALVKDGLAPASVHSMLGYVAVVLRWAHRAACPRAHRGRAPRPEGAEAVLPKIRVLIPWEAEIRINLPATIVKLASQASPSGDVAMEGHRISEASELQLDIGWAEIPFYHDPRAGGRNEPPAAKWQQAELRIVHEMGPDSRQRQH